MSKLVKVSKRMPKALAAYWRKHNKKVRAGRKSSGKRKHNHKEGHVAKSKSKSKRSKSKRHVGGKRRGHRGGHRGHSGGIGGGIASIKSDLPFIIGCGAVGAIEKSLKENGDKSFFAKVPTPIASLGRTGNLALMAYVASFVAPAGTIRRVVREGARAAAGIAVYQMARQGGAFKEATALFSISGPGRGSREHVLDDDEMGALEEVGARRLRGEVDIEIDPAEDAPLVHESAPAATPG